MFAGDDWAALREEIVLSVGVLREAVEGDAFERVWMSERAV